MRIKVIDKISKLNCSQNLYSWLGNLVNFIVNVEQEYLEISIEKLTAIDTKGQLSVSAYE